MFKQRQVTTATLLVALIAIVFSALPTIRGQRRGQSSANASGNTSGTPTGLQFRLSEGTEASERPAALATPNALPLDSNDTAALLKRLAPLKTDAEDEKPFAFRDPSLPAPRAGQTLNEAFPPANNLALNEKPVTAPLEILRYAPEGEVPLAPHLSITFSQPMVAVTSNDDLAAGQVPVKLSPQPAGRWRWLGTKTLLFAPDKRSPMATTYTVEIPANTKSVWGNALAATKRWTFSTPALTVKNSYPDKNEPQKREPLIYLEFDQRISTADVTEKLRITAANRSFAVHQANAAEIEADERVKQLVNAAQASKLNNWLVVKPNETLPSATNCTVTLAAGTPSAEGPRRTTQAHTFSFRTYDALRLERHNCDGERRCEPLTPLSLEFNNQLDQMAFDKNWITITPALPDAKISADWSNITIRGATKGRTTYTVTVNAALKDQFGQKLSTPRTVTFTVGDAQPSLAAAAEGFAVLDPNAPAKFSVFTVNHAQLKVSLYRVTPADWRSFQGVQRVWGDLRGKQPIGKLVRSEVLTVVKAKPDELTETQIDITPALNNGLGNVVLLVESMQERKNRYERDRVYVWLQATQIGLDAFADHSEVVAWATSLRDGKPLNNLQLSLADNGAIPFEKASTDNAGMASFSLTNDRNGKLLIAQRGDEIAFLPENVYGYDESGWQKRPLKDQLRWHVFDDRGLYKPGEQVHIKGWLRLLDAGPQGDIRLAKASPTLLYRLFDSRGNEVTQGNLQVNAWGGFATAFKLPATMNLGYARLVLYGSSPNTESLQYDHRIQVQEFRRPEYEVTVKADAGPHFVKGAADLTVAANYYAGGGLPNAEVSWNVSATATNYTPPNRGDFTFGTWTPWWESGDRSGRGNAQSFTAKTDASGKHTLHIDFDSVAPARPTSVTATANVQDVNRQALGGSTTLLVHPADLYVGLRSPRTFVQQGEPLIVDAIVTDLDGKAIANREIKMQAVQLAWQYDKGEWKQVESNPQDCTVRSNNETVQCRFTPKEGGTYRVRATILDDRERPNQSELTLWVAGGKQPPSRDLAQEKVELIPNQKEYKAGETAEILVQAPFANAEAVLTLRRSGLVRTERFAIAGVSHTLRVPIEDAFTPNIHVQVDLVGATERTGDNGEPLAGLPKRPAYASGALTLSIPPASRKLTATVTPRDKALEPGGTTNVDVELRDAAGKPVAKGEIALVVVDEAVLALTGYKLGDPLASFYPQRGDDVRDHHLREKVTLANPGQLIGNLKQPFEKLELLAKLSKPPSVQFEAMAMMSQTVDIDLQLKEKGRQRISANGGVSGFQGSFFGVGFENEQPISVRANFDALAFFSASLPTDANGRASVTVKLPDNLTRYRVMAVAVAGEKQFGTGEAAITARLPLMVRPSAPRFLNFGDRIELPVVVQNQTDNPMTVDVVVRATNAALLPFRVPPSGGSLGNANQPPEGGTQNGSAGRRVTVPPNDRVEVRFPAATVKPGTARFQIGASSGKWADAAEVSLPVWTPATTEAFAVYGELDKGVFAQPVKAPSDAVKQFGGLEVTTSSTQLQALTDAVIYLSNYPYECAEQISSRVLAIAALRDVLAAFDAKGLPPADVLQASVKRDIERLRGMQNSDGGFGFWRRGEDSWPYLGIHVAHALTRAKAKGFDVPKEMTDKSQQYLRNIERHIPSWYGVEARRSLVAYALFTRTLMNDRDAAKARSLIAQAGGPKNSLDNLPLESLGWLLPVLSGEANSKTEVAAIRRHLANRVEETAGNAHFTTSYGDGAYLMLHSSRRADGIILAALIGDDPTNDLIAKLARGLLAHRKAAGPNAGGWENTQENCWVLLALDRYFNTYEKVTPNFVARVWLGDGYAGEHAFRGRTTERSQINMPMSFLMAQNGSPNLTLAKEGAGRMYYRIGMQYAPTNLQLKAADYGFTVTRVYEAIDDPNDVRRQEDGTWRIKAGAQVRVRLTMVAPARRYHVALVDPLPAGFEALNPALAVTGAIPRDPKEQASSRAWWWNPVWYEHQNLRDERVEAFTSLLWEGVYNYSYVARATTPGVFVVPPTKAEEMYHPETFGRGASERVVIE